MPLETTSNKKFKQIQKPWISDAILKSINKKNNLLKPFEKLRTKIYITVINYTEMKLIIRKSKLKYCRNYFNQHKNNLKKLWTGLKILMKGCFVQHVPSCIKYEGKIYTDPKSMANAYNLLFFCEVAPKQINISEII